MLVGIVLSDNHEKELGIGDLPVLQAGLTCLH